MAKVAARKVQWVVRILSFRPPIFMMSAGAEEQASLEEGMGDQVEDGRDVRADPRREEHVSELTDGRVGQHTLDVPLANSDSGREDGRQGSNPRDKHTRRLGVVKERIHAHDQVDAGGHHGRGVNQSGNRGRALHGVGQPDVEGQLRGLTRSAHEEQQGDPPDIDRRGELQALEDLVEFKGRKHLPAPEHRDKEARITDAVHGKGLEARS
jgi:hypothetical protein